MKDPQNLLEALLQDLRRITAKPISAEEKRQEFEILLQEVFEQELPSV
jgi:hypothetical protein